MIRLSLKCLALLTVISGGMSFGQDGCGPSGGCVTEPGCYAPALSCAVDPGCCVPEDACLVDPGCCAPMEGCVGYEACDASRCFNGRCDAPFGMCVPAGGCLTNSCLANTCIGRCCATKAYPDSGWAPPARLPVNYDRAWYQAYHPQAYYGNAGGGFVANYPQVYQPTDTTQLGYYYHLVPTWQQRPGMIPPTPNPAEFHFRACPGGGCFSGCNGAAACTGPMHHPMPRVAMQRPQIFRPRLADNRGGRNPFRMASLKNLFQ